MYHREPRDPTVRDLALVDLITQTAALVIDREQAQTALREIAAMARPPSGHVPASRRLNPMSPDVRNASKSDIG